MVAFLLLAILLPVVLSTSEPNMAAEKGTSKGEPNVVAQRDASELPKSYFESRSDIQNNYRDGIGNIFVVNLDKSVGRMEYVKKQLDSLGYHFERVRGIDGHKLRDLIGGYANLHPKTQFACYYETKAGLIGCWQSHLQALFKAVDRVESGEPDMPVLLLEDDVHLDADLPDFLRQNLQKLPDDWEILFLGYENPIEAKKLDGLPFCTMWTFWCAHAYLMRNADVVRKLISFSNTAGFNTADLVFLKPMQTNQLKIYFAYERQYAIQNHDSFDSIIGNEHPIRHGLENPIKV